MMYTHERSIIGLMACDPLGVIGWKNKLPWNCSQDIIHFNELINNNVILMGRKTYESIPYNVLSRSILCIVFSKSEKINILPNNRLKIINSLDKGLDVVDNIEKYLTEDKKHFIGQNLKFFMIGGASIAHLFLEKNLISEFFLTKIYQCYNGDTKLNLDLLKQWKKKKIKSLEACSVYHLVRK